MLRAQLRLHFLKASKISCHVTLKSLLCKTTGRSNITGENANYIFLSFGFGKHHLCQGLKIKLQSNYMSNHNCSPILLALNIIIGPFKENYKFKKRNYLPLEIISKQLVDLLFITCCVLVKGGTAIMKHKYVKSIFKNKLLLQTRKIIGIEIYQLT